MLPGARQDVATQKREFSRKIDRAGWFAVEATALSVYFVRISNEGS
jgi:hypothetical protein